MADKKISQLTGATTPLAGTEVLPIVQGGSTVKVSAADITAGRSISASGLTLSGGTANGVVYLNAAKAATSGADLSFDGSNLTLTGNLNMTGGSIAFDDERFVYSYAGGTAGQYQSGIYFDGSGLTQRFFLNNAEVGRWTAGNLQIANGNLVVGTAGKGIDFSANTHAAGMTSELLNWYEEGTWEPTDSSGAGLTLTYTAAEMRYTRIGRNVFIQGRITYPSTASGATALIGGLPFTSSANNRAGISLGYNNFAANYVPFVSSGSALLEFYVVAGSGAQATNANLSATTFAFSGVYTV